jgi:hypothetical protein
MRLKFLSFSNLTLLVALSLSSVAAYYSIIGLTAIFAGAVIPVIIMGSILEVGKITTTVWLRKYWSRASWVLKLYLVPAVIALALLTSMGIFGFLSKAHMEQGITSGDAQGKVAIYDEKIKTAKDNIDANRKALKQLDEAVDQVMGRSTSEQGADKAVAIRRSQANDRKRLLAEIQEEQKTVSKLSEERAPLASELRKVEAEVGPIKYIAALIYGDNADQNMLESAVRWVIILLVIVFDPLAIALVLAANASKEWDNELPDPDPKPDYEPDDAPLTDEQVEQLKASVDILNKGVTNSNATDNVPVSDEELEPCYKCGTPLMNAPGIGPFCPNKECDIADGTSGETISWKYIPPEPVVQQEKSILEQHPYLTKGFDHFEGLKPLVYTPEPEIVEEKPKKKRIPKLKVSEPVVEPTPEPTVDTEITTDNSMKITTPLPYKELDGDYVSFNGGHMKKDALKSLRPDLFMLNVEHGKEVNSDFGTKFPEVASRGDIFTRVDTLPNKVFKYDGSRWIEVNKESSSAYLFNTKYIEYLISAIDKGQYDPELLSDEERGQIEDYLKIQKNTQI